MPFILCFVLRLIDCLLRFTFFRPFLLNFVDLQKVLGLFFVPIESYFTFIVKSSLECTWELFSFIECVIYHELKVLSSEKFNWRDFSVAKIL